MKPSPPLEATIKKNESPYEAKRVDQTSSRSRLPAALEKASATPGAKLGVEQEVGGSASQ